MNPQGERLLQTVRPLCLTPKITDMERKFENYSQMTFNEKRVLKVLSMVYDEANVLTDKFDDLCRADVCKKVLNDYKRTNERAVILRGRINHLVHIADTLNKNYPERNRELFSPFEAENRAFYDSYTDARRYFA
jgi:hypothetical protein